MAHATSIPRGNARQQQQQPQQHPPQPLPSTTTQRSTSTSRNPIPSTKKLLPAPSPLPPSPLAARSTSRHNRPRHRPPKMGNYSVPDDDDDDDTGSCVSEQDMQMDVEGDSFAEQIDGATRVQSDPNWVQQQQQNHPHAEQQVAAAAPTQQHPAVSTPRQQQQNHLRPAQPLSSRAHTPFTSPLHDQHMLDADVPSWIGKRKRSESQPPARDTYQPEPQIINEPQNIQNPHLRRIGGMMVLMCAVTATVLAGIWNYVTGLAFNRRAQNVQQDGQQEITAVETDMSGRKRRAVPSDNNLATPSESPRSQGPNSPSPSPATEAATTSFAPPGAFPNRSLPSPERSPSPAVEEAQARPEKNETYKPDPAHDNPYLYQYNNPAVDSIDPTLAEMRERFDHKKYVSPQDWEDVREEKRQARARRDAIKHAEWAERTDQLKKPEEEAFGKKEEESEQTVRLEAKKAAARVKVGENWEEQNLSVEVFSHHHNHTEGECGSNDHYQKMHECSGLEAHNTAKVVEAEVARDTEEWKKSNMSAAQLRRFLETSAYKPFTIKKARAVPGKPLPQGKQQPKSVATAKKGDEGKGAAIATKDEPSRPTSSSSSHKRASYKGGLAPSPKENGPGDNPKQAWSYDKTMLPGKSLLKSKSKNDLKDKQVDALVDRAKNLKVESPQDQRFKQYMAERKTRDRDYWKAIDEDTRWRKERTRRLAELQRQEAEKQVEEARQKWEQYRLDEEARKDAEIEAARAEERARREAEEAAKRKAEQEAEEARKAEDEKAAARAIKQILIRPLDPEWADRVQKAMDLRDKDAVVATSMDGTELRRHDFGSLLPQEGSGDDTSGWLNDEIVNAFVAAVVTRKQEQAGYKRGANNVPPFEYYNSAWWTTYKKTGGVAGISRWSKRKGIQGAKLLKAEKLFFPINAGGHWMLLIISPQQKDIEFVDSLSRKPPVYFQAAREWLAMELGDAYVAADWTETAGRGSKQDNSDDCGVFVAMNSLASGKGCTFGEVTAAKMPDARKMVAAVLLNGGLRGDWEL